MLAGKKILLFCIRKKKKKKKDLHLGGQGFGTFSTRPLNLQVLLNGTDFFDDQLGHWERQRKRLDSLPTLRPSGTLISLQPFYNYIYEKSSAENWMKVEVRCGW